MAHDVGGGTVPLFKCVRVHAQGDGWIRVTKPPSDCAYIDASPDELGRREVTEVVQTDIVQSERVTNPGEEASDVVGPERLRPIYGVRKDIGIIRDGRLSGKLRVDKPMIEPADLAKLLDMIADLMEFSRAYTFDEAPDEAETYERAEQLLRRYRPET